MILKDIKIRNFRSYYGENSFALSKGLTLIIGDNGDGKTTFFEALEWLFDTTTENKNESNISEKRKSELDDNEVDEVSVSIIFDHDGEKELEKSFSFEKTNNSIRTKDFKFIGYKNFGSERLFINGKRLLEACFDAVIRKYCLFKGESELNVFDNNTALKTLVDTFSNIRQFEDFVKLTISFEKNSDNVVTRELKNDKKQESRVRILEADKFKVSQEISDVKRDMLNQEQAITDYSVSLEKLEQNQDACENYQDIKNRIEKLQQKKARFQAMATLDYNASLLDDYWILRSFPNILNEYQKKVSAFSKEKRKQEKIETERIAREKGKQDALESIQNIANGTAPLPWYVPDKGTMREMIEDEVCKVCGRPAPKGTEAYEFMVNKLKEFLKHTQIQAEDETKENDKPLFMYSFIDELRTKANQLSGWNEQEITKIATDISDRLALIQARKRDLDKTTKDLQEAEDEKARLLIQTQGLSEEILDKGFKDFKGMSERKNRAEIKMVELKQQLTNLEKRKEEIDAEFDNIEPSNGTAKLYQRVHSALKIIMESFIKAKDKNINEFLEMLEKEANNYFEKLNENDFRGQVHIIRKADGSARIQLKSSNGNPILNPGGAQRTTMYMSVLFAISNITTLKRDQDYPLIFDAPTSQFGDYKEDVFYNIIDKIDKQCVIVTKDLLEIDKETKIRRLNKEKIDQLTCSVYQINKAPGYDPLDLSTIQTQITQIK
ncbi:MAG: AAA family ATPase [Massilibacteroides sp.]|nr:AAA family ATPase [Massilibacteroides sp.]MDD4532029.1 AAA family ATPase [Bacilli bacterium]